MRRDVSTVTDFRERVVTYLALLSSEAAHRTLGHMVGYERAAFELCRIWYDDVYVAGHRYFDGLKGDFSKAAAERFRSEFTSGELAALERFSQFLELRLEMLPYESLQTRRIPGSDLWQNIVRDAAYLLQELEPDADVLSRRLNERLAGIDFEEAPDIIRLIEATITRSEG